MSPADLADLLRQTTNNKQQNSLNLKQIVFLCVIMQPAAFLCVICAICGRIYIQTYSINIHRRNPSISRRSRWFTQTKPKTTKHLYLKLTVFLCEIMQLAAFLCVICVICGRIYIQTYSINLHRWNHDVSCWSRWFTQMNPKTTNCKTV